MSGKICRTGNKADNMIKAVEKRERKMIKRVNDKKADNEAQEAIDYILSLGLANIYFPMVKKLKRIFVHGVVRCLKDERNVVMYGPSSKPSIKIPQGFLDSIGGAKC
jgi:hypothetical protein